MLSTFLLIHTNFAACVCNNSSDGFSSLLRCLILFFSLSDCITNVCCVVFHCGYCIISNLKSRTPGEYIVRVNDSYLINNTNLYEDLEYQNYISMLLTNSIRYWCVTCLTHDKSCQTNINST
jgi:hypothetical protein